MFDGLEHEGPAIAEGLTKLFGRCDRAGKMESITIVGRFAPDDAIAPGGRDHECSQKESGRAQRNAPSWIVAPRAETWKTITPSVRSSLR